MGSVQARQICSYKKFRTIPRVERASISELLRGCLCEAGIRNSKRTQGGKLVTLHYYYYTIPQTTKPCHDMNGHHGWVRRYHYHHASASPPLLEARARDRAGGSQIHICLQRFLAFCGLSSLHPGTKPGRVGGGRWQAWKALESHLPFPKLTRVKRSPLPQAIEMGRKVQDEEDVK
ncbi:unnamed protein product [Miscanthus lutarioriparius]|uniref:Uncharacterized protein n=1 Tax=Miscanthus lutarioriparius TaxID=422564 RepID=A0A811MG98_9POAL|nr:unnamed protein product [Miscanthus lutarioriparius]